MLIKPSREAVERIVHLALLEDAPWGDLTSQVFVPASARVRAHLVAREDGVFCGEDVFRAAMSLTDAAIETHYYAADGEHFAKGAVLATVHGPAQAVLQAERVALNFVQRLSGIATLTAQYVLATAGTAARVTDTRKTTPGLRVLERYAVRCGGGHNHRFSLSDAVLVKDNHLAMWAACDGSLGRTRDVTEALRGARASLPHTTHFEVEVDRLDQIEAVLAAGVDTILLDNFTCDQLCAGVRQIAGRALVEASGGVTLDRIAAIAATGVDLISVGALTHSVRALDLGLDVDAGGSVETGAGGPR
jgi:nicotinate-nucleotide pyrophosphorylase (carboxylating)